MSRIFLSHSWRNNAEACALRDWLAEHGWDDVFLDLDPRRGLVAGRVARIWDAATGRQLIRLGHERAISIASFSSDGKN